MSDFLAEIGIVVSEGYRPDNLEPRPDLAVVGNVIRRINPEAVALEQSGIPFVSMPEALNKYFLDGKTRVVIAGTHGKTTLSSMIAWILYDQGLDPGFMIGGLPLNFGKNHRLGAGSVFVVEGDEYDTAYFDKSPKFLHYWPDVAVMTSCEFDHADIYRDIGHIESQFRSFAGMISSTGYLVACSDDPRVKDIAAYASVPVRFYGFGSDAEWSAVQTGEGPSGIDVTMLRAGTPVAEGTLPVFGSHNVSNALAAVAATDCVGVSPAKSMAALERFRGVRRRQEILDEVRGILVMDDFAHHPSAVEATCAAIRSRFQHRRLVAVFEPRTNTSKRSVFQDLYVPAFRSADLVVLREPRDVESLPASDRFSSERLASDLRNLGKHAEAFETTDGVLAFLAERLIPGDVVLIMSNGSFDNLCGSLLVTLRGREP